ncbi:hypothetical protein DY000_02023934 [Brassica cretica]|uniref:Uncharacterized protein n=1 Tax=Brassica cretica TaxID=69181 RepID=A0ABQ7EHI7_BRACR|nr:hypothetical protein DY000_02023934 [Brassica cretica]
MTLFSSIEKRSRFHLKKRNKNNWILRRRAKQLLSTTTQETKRGKTQRVTNQTHSSPPQSSPSTATKSNTDSAQLSSPLSEIVAASPPSEIQRASSLKETIMDERNTKSKSHSWEYEKSCFKKTNIPLSGGL